MRIRPVHIAIIVILVVIVIMTSSAGSVSPYSPDTLFSKQFEYEGMELLTGSNFSLPVSGNIAVKKTVAPIATAKKVAPAGKKNTVQSWGEWITGKPSPKKEDAKKVEGFASLMPAPYAESKILDRYSQASAGPQCVGKSSGLSNSLGALCLSEEDRLMLSSRGGNV